MKELHGVYTQEKVTDKCKKILHVMRCLVGSEWGADRMALKAIYVGLSRSILDSHCLKNWIGCNIRH